MIGLYYLFDYIPTAWTLSRPNQIFSDQLAGHFYSNEIPRLTLILPSSVLLITCAIVLTVGLFLIVTEKHARIGFVVAAFAVYASSARLQPIVYGGNTILFWSAVLGALLSPRQQIERNGQAVNSDRLFTLGTLAVHLQVFSIYFQSGINKLSDGWIVKLTAVEASLRNPHYSNSLGLWLSEHLRLNEVLTLAVMFFEVPLAVMFILGFVRKGIAIKMIFCALAVFFHLGTAVFLNLRFFPYVSIVLLLLIWPGRIWVHSPAPVLPLTNSITNRFGFQRTSEYGVIAVLVLGLFAPVLGLSWPLGFPSQKFAFFSPSPDTKFVDVQIKLQGPDTSSLHLPLQNQDLGVPDFYRQRIQWAVSRFRIKTESWIDFYCRKHEVRGDERYTVEITYVWTHYDDRNRAILDQKKYNSSHSCKRSS